MAITAKQRRRKRGDEQLWLARDSEYRTSHGEQSTGPSSKQCAAADSNSGATKPLVQVTVEVFEVANGQSTISVRPADTSTLSGTSLAGLWSTGSARATAYANLVAVLQRELQNALTLLGAG